MTARGAGACFYADFWLLTPEFLKHAKGLPSLAVLARFCDYASALKAATNALIYPNAKANAWRPSASPEIFGT